MYALGRVVIRKADKLLEELHFRQAYEKLCSARRWFDPDTLAEERAKAAAHIEKSSTKKDQEEKKNRKDVCGCAADNDDEWIQVKNTEKKKATEHTRKGSEQAGWKNNGTRVRNSEVISKTSMSKASVNSNLKSEAVSKCSSKAQLPKTQKSGLKKKPQMSKTLCRYHVGIEQDRAFNVKGMLLGEKGYRMRTIAENTGAKLRIRGRGSGFLEGPDKKEADEPLMICVSAETCDGFKVAVQDIESLLENVHNKYREFCHERNLQVPNLSVQQLEQPGH